LPVIEVYPHTAVFFILVQMSVGMAIINLILGVVCNVATEERERIVAEMKAQANLEREHECEHLYKMCADMDDDGNEELNWTEVQKGYESNEEFRMTLAAMDIQEEDLSIVWAILDEDKSGTVTAKEFATQVFKMKSSETQLLLSYIKYYMTGLGDQVAAGQQKLKAGLGEGQESLLASLKAGQENLVQDLKGGQQDLQRKIRGGQQQLKKDLQNTVMRAMRSNMSRQGDGTTAQDQYSEDKYINEEKDWVRGDLVADIDGVEIMDGMDIYNEQQPIEVATRKSVLPEDSQTLKDAEEEMLQSLRSVWVQCQQSIEDICRRHAKLLQSMSIDQGFLAVIQQLSDMAPVIAAQPVIQKKKKAPFKEMAI
jgi:hypothetical protein